MRRRARRGAGARAVLEVGGDAIRGRSPRNPATRRAVEGSWWTAIGGCLLCHAVPGRGRASGNLGPPLAGVGRAPFSAGSCACASPIRRASIRDAHACVLPDRGTEQVAAAYRGKPILSAQQIEDVVAYLATLKERAVRRRRFPRRRRRAIALPLLPGARAGADVDPLDPLVWVAHQRRAGARGRVQLELPLLADNGNAVPLKVSVDSPMTADDYVKSIHLFSERNPVREHGELLPRPARGQGRDQLARAARGQPERDRDRGAVRRHVLVRTAPRSW